MKKSVIVVVIIILFLGAGAYLFMKNKAMAPTDSVNQGTSANQSDAQNSATGSPNTQTNVKGNTGADYTPPQSNNSGEVAPPNIQVVEVDFDGTKFTPSPVSIKVNDWVFFKNKSTMDFWPASDPNQPLPEFDALTAVGPGKEAKFQFTKAGTYIYHDKLNQKAGGTVVVTQ